MPGYAHTPSEWLTITWFDCAGNFGAIRNFRHIAALGMPQASKVFYQAGYRTPELLKEISSGRWHFPDDTLFQHAIRDQIGELMRETAIEKGQNSVDAASLVFAHSILDYCVSECCRISANVRMEDWEPEVTAKKVTLTEVRAEDYATVLRRIVDKHVEEQCRGASLVARIDVLNRKCQPIPPFEHDNVPYKYDSGRLRGIDLRRQEIIHRTAFNLPFGSIDDDLTYLEATSRYVMRLVNFKYRLRIDPQWSPQNRPMVVTSKPANEKAIRTSHSFTLPG